MGNYRKILVLSDEQATGARAIRRGAELARVSGAELTIARLTYRRSIAALDLISRDLAEGAIEYEIRPAAHVLEATVDELRKDGIRASGVCLWGHPALAVMLDKIDSYKPDLVIKDVDEERVHNPGLMTPLDWHLVRLCPCPLMLVGERNPALPKRILAAVDLAEGNDSYDERIVSAAQALALQCDAALYLVHTFEYSAELTLTQAGGAAIPESVLRQLRAARARNLQAFCRFADRFGVPAERREFVERGGEAAQQIAAFADSNDIDLIVMGTSRRTALSRLFIGSTAEGLLRRVKCDVAVIKPQDFAWHAMEGRVAVFPHKEIEASAVR